VSGLTQPTLIVQYPSEPYMLVCPTKAEARRICKLMTLAGPAAVRASKELVMGVAYRPIDDELIQYTADWLAKVRADDESVSGMESVQKGTKPVWAEKELTLPE